MIKGLLGKKIGMTQIIDENGVFVPVSVIQAGPCVVIQKKSPDKDNYWALQMGLVEAKPKKNPTKPILGHFKQANIPPTRFLREIRFEREPEQKVGDKLYADVFAKGEKVKVTGLSKGKGFQGVVKRHNFGGGRKTHGARFHREPGSIGSSAWPSKVIKGKRMPGRMGHDRVTVRNLEVVQVSKEENYLLIKGAVPGAKGTYLIIQNLERG